MICIRGEHPVQGLGKVECDVSIREGGKSVWGALYLISNKERQMTRRSMNLLSGKKGQERRNHASCLR